MESLCSVKYTSFEKVVEMGNRLVQGANMDINSAFRLLPVFPGEFDLLGFKFEYKVYFYNCFPNRRSISSLDHYLDGFIFAGERYTALWNVYSNIFIRMPRPGDPYRSDKHCGPCITVSFPWGSR